MNQKRYQLGQGRSSSTFLLLPLFFACSAPVGSGSDPEESDDLDGGSGGGLTDGTGGAGDPSSGGGPSTGGTSAAGGTTTTGGSSGTGGGIGSGGSEGQGTCTPGGEGFSAEQGYVVDNATCVHYQVFDAVPARLPHAEAIAACEALSLGGFDDWRLPTVLELSAIVKKGVQPSVDAALFPNTDLSMYWTSMTTGEKVTALDFYNDGFQNDHIGPDGAQAYRCVR